MIELETDRLDLSQLLASPTPPVERLILRPVPEEHSFFQRKFDDTYKNEIEAETKEEINSTKQRFKAGKWSFTGQDSFAIQTKVRKKYESLHLQQQLKVAMWVRSERMLNLLRTKGQTPKPDDTAVTSAFQRFIHNLQHSYFPEMDPIAIATNCGSYCSNFIFETHIGISIWRF